MKHFTADLHLDDERIFNHRNKHCSLWLDIDTYNRDLLWNINKYVEKKDTLYILGDMTRKSMRQFRPLINCKQIHLIIGNHDNRSNDNYFSSSQDTRIVRLEDRCGEKVNCYLSHYATAYWPGSHNKWVHLYGHCHDQREQTLNAIWPERRSIDCGIDTAYRLFGEHRPFNECEIMDILGDRTGHDSLSFYEPFED